MKAFNIILFDGFETLDALGPAEMIGKLSDIYNMGCYSLNGGAVTSFQNISVNTAPFERMDTSGVLLIPGGQGTRRLVQDSAYVERVKNLAQSAQYVLTVCTGSALLARTGLLSGKSATSNKSVFDWVSGIDTTVNWVKKARWVTDGKYYTSSGVSAGMDMVLGFVSDIHGAAMSEEICRYTEYIWNRDSTDDPFADYIAD